MADISLAGPNSPSVTDWRGSQQKSAALQKALQILANKISEPTPQFDRPYLTAGDAAMQSEEAQHQQQVQQLLQQLMEKFRRGGGMPPLGGVGGAL